MKQEFNFKGVMDQVAKKLQPYLADLAGEIGENLSSIVVYGSAVAGEFDPKRSNINLIVVVEELDLDLLHRVQPLIQKGTRKGIVAPLFFTCQHMDTSSDVFPIEFLDMSDFHEVIYGPDPFARFEIGTENLRLESEEKLKGSLINLRQGYLEVADKRGPMMDLISSSITGIISICRGLIRLAGEKAPASKKEVIRRMAELYPVEADSFLKALEIKLTAPRITRQEMDAFFASYLDDLEELALHVDRMAKKRTSKSGKSRKKTSAKKKPAKSPKRRGKKS